MKITEHARQRIGERTSLKPVEILMALQPGTHIWVKGRQRATHHIFYSIKDQKCFIAVVSQGERQLLTVTPAGEVSPGKRLFAEYLAKPHRCFFKNPPLHRVHRKHAAYITAELPHRGKNGRKIKGRFLFAWLYIGEQVIDLPRHQEFYSIVRKLLEQLTEEEGWAPKSVVITADRRHLRIPAELFLN